MIGWPLSPACAVACRFGDESQQPIFPQVMHIRRCTQLAPIFRHSSQPSIVGGRAVTSIRSRWLQIGWSDIGAPFGACEDEGKVACLVGPPRVEPQAGAFQLELERLPAELRADLDAEPLALREPQFEAEALHPDGVRLECAQAD